MIMRADIYKQSKATSEAEALLFDYASGTLDDALSLIVATHLSLSESSRSIVQQCEDIGGHMLAFECPSETISPHCLQSILTKLDDDRSEPKLSFKNHPLYVDHILLPEPLGQALQDKPTAWHYFMQGMDYMDVMKCKTSKAQLLRIAPAVKIPDHSHRGLEVTLILDGAFHDETGEYHVGDLIVEDETTTHAPVSCPRQGCVCLTVTTAPIKLTGWMGTLINPFLR